MTADQEKLLRNIEETRVGLGLAPPKTAAHPDPTALKPCPFCGGEGKFVSVMGEWKSRAEGYGPDGVRIACSTSAFVCCAMSPPFYGDGMTLAAIAAWNRRVGTT